MAPHRIVLVGVGRMGQKHRLMMERCAAQGSAPPFQLAALVDPSAHDASTGAVARYDDLRALPAASYDAAIVATPTSTHAAVVRALLAMGKHVLVEKPIASTSEEGLQLCALAEQQGLVLRVGHVERFNPAVGTLRALLDANVLGPVERVSCVRSGGSRKAIDEGRDVLTNLAIHDLDLLRWLLGPLQLHAASVHSQTAAGVIDEATVHLEAAGGAELTVHTDARRSEVERSWHWQGKDGRCTLNLRTGSADVALPHPRACPAPSAHTDALEAQFRAFLRALTGDVDARLTEGRDACEALRLAERAAAQA